MTGSAPLALWQPPPRPGGRAWPHRAGVFCLGVLATACLSAWLWQSGRPDTVVRTRIVADGGSGPAARTALAAAAMAFAGRPGDPVLLRDAALEVRAHDPDPAVARQLARSLVDAILDAPAPAAAAVRQAEPVPGAQPALRAEQARLLAAAETAERRSAEVSAALTAVARDMAASLRATADRKAAHATPDKGAAALADLQLLRFQLLARYQADYPAVVALEGQIRDLRAFLADEARRADAARAAPPDPADAVLTAERDRLRGELVQLDDRRRGLAADIAGVSRRLGGAAPVPAATMPVALPPVLVEASTTAGTGPDGRAGLVGGVAAAGLTLSALTLLLGRRREQADMPWRLGPSRPGFVPLPPGEGMEALPGEDAVWLRLPAARPREAAPYGSIR